MSRQLSIRTNVVRRLLKEVTSYQQEAEGAQRTADAMRAKGEDPYKIKQQDKVVEETLIMIPDSQKRLAAALQELRDLVTQHEAELSDTEEYKKAEEIMEIASV